MKNWLYILCLSMLSAQALGSVQNNLNGAEAFEQCQSQIELIYSQGGEIDFKARPASSLRRGVYTFWINSTALIEAGGRETRRYLCEIDRHGEVLAITEETGRWKY